mmetsp:Transcript_22082/g.71246  ORF Transcript_22082/g.71246 Transcript_22082/m.71246 type:complete len:222 (+) Transcript_22082:1670-2335(+)
MSGSSELSSRACAWMASCMAAVAEPASAFSRLYSTRCRFPISRSPRASASCCSLVARASASEMSASCRSRALTCLAWARCVSSTLSSDLACCTCRRSMCLISSRSLIAAGFWPSIFCCKAASARSRSTARRPARALSFSTARSEASAAACAWLTPLKASSPSARLSRSFTISRSVTSSRWRYWSFCSSRRRSSSRWYASASSFCRRMRVFSAASPFFFWWL